MILFSLAYHQSHCTLGVVRKSKHKVRTDKGGKEESIVHRVVKPCQSIGNVEEQQNLFKIA